MKQKGFAPIIILILLVLVGVGVYYFGTIKNKSVSTPVASVQPSSSPLAKPTTDPTANWKIYSNQSLGFELKYPPSVKITRETNDEFNRVTEFEGPGISFGVMLRKNDNITLDNYYYMDNAILQKASLGGKDANVYIQDASKNPCVSDGSGPGCPISFIAYVAENRSDIYHLDFYGDEKLSELESQILSTFKFTR